MCDTLGDMVMLYVGMKLKKHFIIKKNICILTGNHGGMMVCRCFAAQGLS